MAQEMQKFSMAVVGLPLGNIARNRNRGSSDLVGEAVNLFSFESYR